LYIGAGQPEPRYDVAGGTGVFKSIDGGATWRGQGLEKTRHIGRIWIDPRDPRRVLVAAVGDFFVPGEARGVFRSTDGGASWSRALDLGPDTGAVDLTADPQDPDTVFASAWQARQYPWQSYFTPVVGPGSGVYKSIDGGANWTRLGGRGWPAGPLGRISLAATRAAGALRLYAVVDAEKTGGLYRSDDGGASWALVNGDPAFSSYYASRVTVAPNDPDVVWLVGQSMRRCAAGGKTCEIVKGAPGGDDYHQVWINPARPDHMATASDQGVVVSVDAGKTWSSWYNQPTGQFYHLATDDRFPYRIYSGQQDSGTVGIASRSDYGAVGYRDWRPAGGDERDYDIPDPDDPDIVYGSGLGGRISRWNARTGQAANITPFPEPNYGQRQTTTAHHFTWVTPLAVSRAGPTTLYLGGEVVFASIDRGAHWSIISPDLTGKKAGARGCDGEVRVADAKSCGYGGIWALAPSPRHAGELWVGTDDGLIQLTRDGGAHWADVTPPTVPAWAKVAAIDLSPLEDGVAYAAVDNHRQGDLKPRILATRDHGATWRDATGDMPAGHFVEVVRADPVREGLIYAGTEVGVFASLDDGAHWSALQNNLPTALVNDLLVHGDDLIAATQGRAIWVLDDLTPLRQASPAIAGERLHLFAPAPAVRVRADNNRDTPLPPEEPAGQNPPDGAIIDYWLGAPAKGPVTLDIRDARGDLVQRLSSEPRSAPDAERYFARNWTRPAPLLSRTAGPHRAVWNLRYARPSAIAFDYSIAAIAGRDTPIVPGGAYAPPGGYQLVLNVDGRTRRAALRLDQDPRTHVAPADFQASLALSRTIAASLATARRGFGEMAAVHAALAGLT
ncbi:MAG: WD40/YVTN/BNR-like repeat-containing protein, partial [Caulobacteraceae bacterium]